MLTKILRHHGFDVYGIGCKVGAQPKTSVGYREECCAVGVNMCNPILQASVKSGETDLNIVRASAWAMTACFINMRKG